mgnify:CR=1 FL=1
MKLSYTQTLDEMTTGSFVLSEAIARRTVLGKRWVRVALVYGVVLLVSAFNLLNPNGAEGSGLMFLLLPVVLITVAFAVTHLKADAIRKNQLRKTHGDGPFLMDIEVDDTTFQFRTGQQELRFGWSGVAWLDDTPEGLAFGFHPQGYAWIPNTAFADDDERTAWKTHIEARIADAEKLRGDA